MLLVNDFVLPPSVGGLVILKYLTVLVLLIHLPFVFILIGGSALSLVFNLLDKDRANHVFRRFAKEIMDRAAINKWAGIILGLVPLVVLILLFYQMLYGTEMANTSQWWQAIAVLFVSFVLLYAYKDTFPVREKYFLLHFGCGVLGFFLLLGAYLIFIANKSFILYPEVWKLEANPLWLAFSSNIITSYLYFLALAFVVTGAGIIFYFRPQIAKENQDMDKEYLSFTRKSGLLVALIFTLLQPVIATLDLIVLPEPAVSGTVIGCHMAGLCLGMVMSLTICFCLLKKESRPHLYIPVLAMFALALFIAYDNHIRSNSLTEQSQFLWAKAEASAPKFTVVKREKGAGIAEVGQNIYQTYCTACHATDGTIRYGPSFKNVYGRKEHVITNGQEREVMVEDDYIKDSILTPAKDIVKGFEGRIMPAQNLNDQQILDIIAFLKSLK